MKKIAFAALVLLFSNINGLQAQGIEFQHISLEDALQKAKEENKLVFIDFYTTWCGPCKMMDKQVFPLPEVGSVYNTEFVSIKLDAEKGGRSAAKKYEVSAYPTFVFLTPNGNLVYRDTGAKSTENFIELGHNASTSVESQYSLEQLQSDFPNKLNDEHFLKIYIEKLEEYGQSPVLGIEAWLEVQTEIEEDDVDMMEFLLNNTKYLITGGKAEAILKANFDEYMDIATRREEKTLNRLQPHMVLNTKVQAMEIKSPELMERFMEAWGELPEKYRRGSMLEHELVYYSMTKDDENYKATAIKYIDSVMAKNPIAEVQKKDQEFYYENAKKYEGSDNEKVNATLKKLKTYGKYSTQVALLINHVGQAYLVHASNKTDYKVVNQWLDYGYELQPNSCYMHDLRAQYYYAKGKYKKAIQLKEQALNNWPEEDKSYSKKAYELEKIKKNTVI